MPTTTDDPNGLRFTDVRFIGFTAEVIHHVAKEVGVTEERVRAYLADPWDRDGAIYHALRYISGAYPTRAFRGIPPKPPRPTCWKRIMENTLDDN